MQQAKNLIVLIPDKIEAYDKKTGKLVYEQEARVKEPLTQNLKELLMFRSKKEQVTFEEALTSHFRDVLCIMERNLSNLYPHLRIEIFITDKITVQTERPKRIEKIRSRMGFA